MPVPKLQKLNVSLVLTIMENGTRKYHMSGSTFPEDLEVKNDDMFDLLSNAMLIVCKHAKK